MVNLWLETKPLGASLYFLALFASLVFVLSKIPRTSFSQRKLWVFPVIAALALYFTWKNKVNFMIQPYPDVITWINNSDPVVKKYQVATDTAVGMWCSCQLFMFVLSFVGFLNTKARYVDMSMYEVSAYVWLGFGGAISVSFPLFLFHYYGTLALSDKSRPRYRLPTWGFEVLGVFLWLAFWSIASLPLVKDLEFELYLLLIHIFLVLPSFIPANPLNTVKEHKMILPVYIGLTVLIMTHHWYVSYVAISEASNLTSLLRGISLDFLFTLIECSLYILFETSCPLGMPVLVPFLLFTPFLSLGATFALVMIYEVCNVKCPTDRNANKSK